MSLALMLLKPTYSFPFFCNSHQLIPPEKTTGYNLRERSHNLTIPLIDNNILRENFLYRLLFRDMYQLRVSTNSFLCCLLCFILYIG